MHEISQLKMLYLTMIIWTLNQTPKKQKQKKKHESAVIKNY